MQKLLMKRKSELETQLVRARGTDFANVRTDVAGIGTVVKATDLETGQAEQFTILGAWDSEPEKGIISYLSPVAQSLLNRNVGDDVEFEVHGVKHHHRIDAIEAYLAPSTAQTGAVPANSEGAASPGTASAEPAGSS
jgi:transcription elongation GreA/GreB family factor